MNTRLSCACALALGLVTFSVTARSAEPPARATTDADGYGYIFGDDILAAGGLSPKDARLHVIRHGVRNTLIRPRTAFIRELLTSIENL